MKHRPISATSRRARSLLAACTLPALFAAGCGSAETSTTVHGTAVDHGRALFESTTASASASNPFTCATCHRAEASTDDAKRLDPGASLAGVVMRTTFWGGQRVDLLASINDCRMFFMDARAPWTADDEDARAMYAFLAQLPAPAGAVEPAVSFTVVESPGDLPPGDARRGADVYERACKTCHGQGHAGSDRLASFIPALPDAVVRSHGELSPAGLRLVFINKVRAGAFRDGSMPPFSREVLTDEDLAATLAYLALYETR